MLKAFQYGGESQSDPAVTGDLGAHPPKLPTIEISSLGPGQGKTQLLYFMIAASILPDVDTETGVNLNGQNSAVVVFDTDGRFNISRLAQVIQFYVSIQRTSQHQDSGGQDSYSAQEIIANENDSALIHKCLEHVHMFTPGSFESLLATLTSLEEYLSDFEKHFSAPRPLSAIFLDSVNAFYWQERRKTEDAKIPTHQESNDASSSYTGTTSLPNSYALLRQNLNDLAWKYSCPVIVTNRSNGRNIRLQSHEATIAPDLPMPWPAFPTLRLYVRRVPVDKFPPMHSMQEALRDRIARQNIVSQGRYEILLNHWAMETWSENLKSALEGRATTIPMWIGGEGVWAKEDGLPSAKWPPWVDVLKPE